MRHLDAQALTQLIGVVAEVVAATSTPVLRQGPRDVPASLDAAIDRFEASWRVHDPAVRSLSATVDQLAAAGMAFFEGDPATAGALVAHAQELVPEAPTPGRAAGRSLAEETDRLASDAAAAEQAAAELAARSAVRRAFPDAGASIDALRRFASGHREAADALLTYTHSADAARTRRRVVLELLDDTHHAMAHSGGAQSHALEPYLDRLRDKAAGADAAAVASASACVAVLDAAGPAPAELALIHTALTRTVAALRTMLAEAAAAELEEDDGGGDRAAAGRREAA